MRKKSRMEAIKLIEENKNNCVNDVYHESGVEYSALCLAIEAGDSFITELLIKKGAALNNMDICNEPYFYRQRITDNKDPKVQAAYKILLKARIAKNRK